MLLFCIKVDVDLNVHRIIENVRHLDLGRLLHSFVLRSVDPAKIYTPFSFGRTLQRGLHGRRCVLETMRIVSSNAFVKVSRWPLLAMGGMLRIVR